MAKTKLDLFYNNFVGEFVDIITKIESSSVEQNEEQTVERTQRVSFSAFVVDVDDNNYYLGEEPDEVSICIGKNEVSMMQIAELETEISPYEHLLDDMPDPESDDEVN